MMVLHCFLFKQSNRRKHGGEALLHVVKNRSIFGGRFKSKKVSILKKRLNLPPL